jgi:alanine racemase
MTSAAYALIDLDAVKHNIRKVKAYAPMAKIMAVIKANAYGHGLLRVAEVLTDVDAIAVARVDEGVSLRQAGCIKRITILEGFVCKQELDKLLQYNLEIVVHSPGQLEIIQNHQGQEKISVWLKLDTGMNRLGFKPHEFLLAYRQLSACSQVKQPISLMTHLSCADNLKSLVSSQQISLFNNQVKGFSGEKSIANSAAIIAWPDSLTDWVRPGIMLYGVSPFSTRSGEELGLKSVMSLYSRLISVKSIEAGETVGYASTWASKKATRIGVVAIGYGDGYPRYVKNGTPVLVNGKKVPLVGRVSMDMITVDLGGQIDAKPGDLVTLWGKGLAVEEIAKYANTIPYTLLCGITQRVEIKNG